MNGSGDGGSTAIYQVALDPGNWGGKGAADGRGVVMRSVATPYLSDDVGLDGMGLYGDVTESSTRDGDPKTESVLIRIGSVDWLVGQAAEDYQERARQVVSQARYGSDEWFALIMGLLVKLYGRRSGVVGLTMSLPISQIRARRSTEIREYMIGVWEVGLDDRVLTFDIREDMFDLLPEGLGSFGYCCLSPNGLKFSDRELASSRVVVFDFGGFTLDILTFLGITQKGPYNESINRGLIHVRNEVERALMHRFNRGERMPTSLIDRVIRTGKYRQAGSGDIDVKNIVDDSLVDLMRDALRVWREDLGAGSDWETVIITGGGAPVIGPLLKAQMGHGDVRIIGIDVDGEAHMANVQGGLRLRRFKGEYAVKKA